MSERASTPEAIQLLRENPKSVFWGNLALNPSREAIQLLRENPEKINWNILARNTSPEALQLLRENPDKIDWYWLSCNRSPEALQFLSENPNRIIWSNIYVVAKHTSVYKILYPYNYEMIAQVVSGPFREELLAKTLQPMQI